MDVDEPKFAKECRIGMKWKLKDEDIKNVRGHGFLKSRVFKARIPGVEYSLRMHPNGRDESERNQVMGVAFGKTLCTRDELFGPFKYGIMNTNLDPFDNGVMEVELEGIIKADRGKNNELKSLSLGSLLNKCEDDKDVIIVVGEEQIKIHKCVISACSPVFKAELNNSGFKEAIEKKIDITDFNFETIVVAVDYFYGENIRYGVYPETAAELLRFTDKYDIKPMHEFIQAELIDMLNDENVVELANMSITFNAHQLRDFCISFLLDASVNSKVVKDIEKLQDEIKNEFIQRSFLSFS